MPFVQATVFLIFTLIACSLASTAIPVEARGQIRAGYNCADRHYFTKDQVQAVDRAALIIWRSESLEVRERFHGMPSKFPNHEGLAFSCGGGPYRQFPIMSSGLPFDGEEDRGPFRIIFNEAEHFCGVIYNHPMGTVLCEEQRSPGSVMAQLG